MKTKYIIIVIAVLIIAGSTGYVLYNKNLLAAIENLQIFHQQQNKVEGYVVAIGQSSSALTFANVKDVIVPIESVDIKNQAGSWYSIGTSSDLHLIQHSAQSTSTILGQATIPSGTYVAVRYTFGSTTVDSKTGQKAALTPASDFIVPINVTIDPGKVSSVKLQVVAKQSLSLSSSTYSFAPYAIVESRTNAEIVVTSNDQNYISLNDGDLDQALSVHMQNNGAVVSDQLAIVPPLVDKSTNTFYQPRTSSMARVSSAKAPAKTVTADVTPSAAAPDQPDNTDQTNADTGNDTTDTPTNTNQPVDQQNQPPIFNYIGSQDAEVGTAMSFTVNATDADNDPLNYGALVLPNGAIFDPSSQTFTWTPSAAGNYSAILTVSDGMHTIDVTVPISVTGNPNITPVDPPVNPTNPVGPVDPVPVNPVPPVTVNNDLQVTFDASHYPVITYKGTDISDGGAGGWIESAFMNKSGSGYEGNNKIASTSWDDANSIRTDTFAWGIIKTQYAVTANRLTTTYTVTNTSADTMLGFNVHGPMIYTNGSGGPVAAFGTVSPAAVAEDFDFGAMAMVDDDPSEDVYLDISSTDRLNLHILRFGTESEGWNAPTSWPVFSNKPIASGASQTYAVSLRFGPKGSSAATLVPDAYSSFTARFPFKVNWSDKRPIGAIYPSNASPSSRTATNPRGWFNDGSVDVTTTAGLDAFKAELLQYATTSLAALQKANAQGIIVWDIEGEGYPFDYAGDPRVATKLAPELDYQNAVDTFFKIFTNAGMKVGLTIRPQDVTVPASGAPYATEVTAANQAQEFISKINYAKNRWGATLFYIDSTDANTIDPILAQVQAAEPDVLLIPENENFGSYEYSAPYNELRQGYTGSESDIYAVYPHAFSVINIDDVSDISGSYSALVSSVQKGDILLFNGKQDNSAQQEVMNIYRDAGSVSLAKQESGLASVQVSMNTLFIGVISGFVAFMGLLDILVRKIAKS